MSVSDIVATKQDGVVIFHYCDSFDFMELPKFAEPKPLALDSFLTGEKIATPRGSFALTAVTREQMQQAGYGYHHSSDNGVYHIMGNGTHAFAIVNEDSPSVAQLEQDAKSGRRRGVACPYPNGYE